jgi:hypothetical protein
VPPFRIDNNAAVPAFLLVLFFEALYALITPNKMQVCMVLFAYKR